MHIDSGLVYTAQKKVTGLYVKDFELLVSLNVFNSSLMNDAVWKFKRYEDASLTYTGISKHENSTIGLFDTVVSQTDKSEIYENKTVDSRFRRFNSICVSCSNLLSIEQ